jgi:N6-L-threonylcarbamoyladenine synthase
MIILAIESSCDETAAAVIKDGTEILNSVVATSTAMHEKWGGIVPEVAAREQLTSILPVLTEALSYYSSSEARSIGNKFDDKFSPPTGGSNNIKSIIENNIDAIAVTVGPGLIGSLLIGVETAKTLAFVTGKPIIPVNHVLAHIYANFLKTENRKQKTENEILRLPPSVLRFPTFHAISLVVSGGHTELFLMKSEKELQWLGGTIDDAAGEAFDKSARLLGFGSRGGLAIEKAASRSEVLLRRTISLPRPMIRDETLNFSFSGLKTAVMREVQTLKDKNQWSDEIIQQLSYEVQEAITDVLVAKTLKAVELHNAKSILISGGVASNSRLREKMKEVISRQSSVIRFLAPEAQYCTDNAAFIGSYAYFRGKKEDWHNITPIPDLSVEG